jgi:drug/metabolite transporter (DMT)-like permease
LGLLFATQIAFFNQGTSRTSPAFAIVLFNSHPVWANLIGHLAVTGERLTAMRAAGLVLAIGGLSYVFLGAPDPRLAPDPVLGNLIILGAAFLYGALAVYTRRVVQEVEPLRAIVWEMVISLPVFLGMALLTEQPTIGPVTARALSGIAYQGVIVAGVCFVGWAHLLRRHTAGALSMFTFTVPLFGVALSWVVFGEPISARLLVGVALVTFGIVVSQRSGATRSAGVE